MQPREDPHGHPRKIATIAKMKKEKTAGDEKKKSTRVMLALNSPRLV
jgi:hypothetical protein